MTSFTTLLLALANDQKFWWSLLATETASSFLKFATLLQFILRNSGRVLVGLVMCVLFSGCGGEEQASNKSKSHICPEKQLSRSPCRYHTARRTNRTDPPRPAWSASREPMPDATEWSAFRQIVQIKIFLLSIRAARLMYGCGGGRIM